MGYKPKNIIAVEKIFSVEVEQIFLKVYFKNLLCVSIKFGQKETTYFKEAFLHVLPLR